MDNEKYYYSLSVYYNDDITKFKNDFLVMKNLEHIMFYGKVLRVDRKVKYYFFRNSISTTKRFSWPGIKIHLSRLSFVLKDKIIYAFLCKNYSEEKKVLRVYRNKYKIINNAHFRPITLSNAKDIFATLESLLIETENASDEELYLAQ